MQLDADEKITNIFWVDTKMIIYYGCFGDAISLDETFRTHKEFPTFACLIGFNHHKKTITFGAALLYDEIIESSQWLFETFLEAMLAKKPITIFMDQDGAMVKVISLAMPKVYH